MERFADLCRDPRSCSQSSPPRCSLDTLRPDLAVITQDLGMVSTEQGSAPDRPKVMAQSVSAPHTRRISGLNIWGNMNHEHNIRLVRLESHCPTIGQHYDGDHLVEATTLTRMTRGWQDSHDVIRDRYDKMELSLSLDVGYGPVCQLSYYPNSKTNARCWL